MTSKTAFITGGSRGIGLGIAESLAKLGFNLFLVSRTKDELEKTRRSLTLTFPHCAVSITTADVSIREEIQSSFNRAVEEFKAISVVVNNAGVYIPGTGNLSPEDVDSMMDINYKGALWLSQVAMPHFVSQKQGYLINISSVSGLRGFSHTGGYCASKFALMGLNQALYREYAHKGIKVTALCPSWVNTQMVAGRSSLSPEQMIQPRDLGLTVEYLLSLSPAACPQEIVIECAFE